MRPCSPAPQAVPHDPPEVAASPAPFAHDTDYLVRQLRRLDHIIRLALFRLDGRDGGAVDPELRGLVVTRQDVDALLDDKTARRPGAETIRGAGEDDFATLQRLEQDLAARVAGAWAAGRIPRLEVLAALFRLTPFERDVLIVLLAPELDRKYDRLYAYLQDDVTRRRPSVGLVLDLLCRSPNEIITARAAFQPDRPLRLCGLVTLTDGLDGDDRSSVLSRALALEPRIVDYVLHGQPDDPDLEPATRRLATGTPIDDLLLPDAVKRHLRHLAAHFGRALSQPETSNGERGPGPLCELVGRYGSGKTAAAAAVCQALDLTLLAVDAVLLPQDPWQRRARLRRLHREAVLNRAALLFEDRGEEGDDRSDGGSRTADLVRPVFPDLPVAVFVAIRRRSGKAPLADRGVPRITLPECDHALRVRTWRRDLAARWVDADAVDVDALANQFRFTAGQIGDALTHAGTTALLNDGPDASIHRTDLLRGCRAQTTVRLGHLAHQLVPTYDWDDIVLPADAIALLLEMCHQVRLQHRVMDDWGFGRKMPRGRGVAALFSGASGTGKTMAADIIAGELAMDVYKIDLSCIVSKYIGETEKNIAQVFKEAEQSNAILFFDEADALFGHRSEVKDSHDRYANIEISFLLQEIEDYEGVVILATNMRHHLDEAFTRRLRVCIEFPFPDEAHRRRIWQSVFPDSAPLDSDIDFDFLAQRFKLSGGNIRNTALASAFFAATDQSPVTMSHIVRAVRREYQKLGRIPTKADFGKYYRVVAEQTAS